MHEILEKAEARMKKSAAALGDAYAGVRAGRANPAVLDKIKVDYYGTPTAINQLAAIAVTEARVLTIQPWDGSVCTAIERAIQASDIGINPQSDGKTIRIMFPQLTEDRRRELVKEISKMAEETKITVRSTRRDAIEKLKALEKKSELSEDELKKLEKKAQDLTDRYVKEIETLFERKQKEIMEI